MIKIKHPFVKVLRKAGYSTKEAMDIAYEAKEEYQRQRPEHGLKHFTHLAKGGYLGAMFRWDPSKCGWTYWQSAFDGLYQTKTTPWSFNH